MDGWTDRDEVDFITHLGRYASSASKVAHPLRRARLLEGYLEAMSERQRWWPGADVDGIRAYAMQKLREAQ